MNNLTSKIKKLITLRRQEDILIAQIELKLKDHIPFNFSINYFPAEGYVVLHEELALNCQLTTILYLVNNKKEITEEYFKQYGQ